MIALRWEGFEMGTDCFFTERYITKESSPSHQFTSLPVQFRNATFANIIRFDFFILWKTKEQTCE